MANAYKGYIMIGYREDGSEIRKYCSATTPKGLERKKIELRKKYLTGELSANVITVRDYTKVFLETKKMREASTYRMYESVIRLHINPVIGHLKMHEVKQIHIQSCINNLVDKPRTATKVKMALKQIFDAAYANDYTGKNPVIKIETPSDKSAPKRCLNDIERHTLGKANLTIEQRVFVGLMMRCGLADNEVAGMRKKYIDLKAKKIQVRGVVDLDAPSGSDSYKPYPKTKSRFRDIPIPDDLSTSLALYLPNRTDFLFQTKSGGYLTSSAFRARWGVILRKWNDEAGGASHIDLTSKKIVFDRWAIGSDLTPYYLRHEYASDLLRSGYTIPEAMYLMGHSTRKMLLEVYAHIEADKITAEKLNGGFTEVSPKLEKVSEK